MQQQKYGAWQPSIGIVTGRVGQLVSASVGRVPGKRRL